MKSENITAQNPKPGELVLFEYEGHKPQIGQIASDENISNPLTVDETKNLVYVHVQPQSHPTGLEIDKIKVFQLISKIPMKTVLYPNGTATYTTLD